jgi:hypothetical protein
MEDLNLTYAHLLTDGSELWEAYAISPDGRYIVGRGYNAATGREEAFLLDTQGTGVEERLPGWARWAAMGARLLAFPPMAPWWSAGLATLQGRSVPFAGRRLGGCRTSARWAAI